jgi:hypothetical protein
MTTETQHEAHLPGCRIRLYVWMALLALFQLGALLNALQVPPSLPTALPLPLEVAGAALWTVIFLLAAFLLLRGAASARRFAFGTIIAFVCYNLLRWIAFTKADYNRERLPILLIASFIVILSAALIGFRRGQPLGTEKRADDPEPTN